MGRKNKSKNIMDELRIYKDFSVGDLVQARKILKFLLRKSPKIIEEIFF